MSVKNNKKIKVSELIEKLSKLDPDRNIHLIYDYYYDVPFDIEVADDCQAEGVEDGDYIINVS